MIVSEDSAGTSVTTHPTKPVTTTLLQATTEISLVLMVRSQPTISDSPVAMSDQTPMSLRATTGTMLPPRSRLETSTTLLRARMFPRTKFCSKGLESVYSDRA